MILKIGADESQTVILPVGCQQITSSVKVTKGLVKHTTGNNYTLKITIANASTAALPAKGSLILTGLTSSATLTNGGGATCPSSDGAAYISYTFTGTGTSQTVTFTLDFTDASTSTITFTPRVLAP